MALIYCVTFRPDGRVYIGKTLRTLEARKVDHYKAVRRGSRTYFHKALRKYSPEEFLWEVLEHCSPDQVDQRERFFIRERKALSRELGFNLHKGGTGQAHNASTREAISKANKGRKLTPEQKATISARHWSKDPKKSVKIRAKLREIMTGRKLPEATKEKLRGRQISESTRIKMSQAHLGQTNARGHKHSPATRKRMSESHQGVPKGAHTDQTKKKISIAKKGNVPWNKGKGLPEHANEEELRRLYWEEELSTLKIGERWGVSWQTVRRWMKRWDIPLRERGAKND